MEQLLYTDLLPWYRLIDPPGEHLEEAIAFTAAFERVVAPRPETLLELGSGAGHNAVHLKRRFCCTLSDVSEGMLALSRELNAECEHVLGDMRTLRLGRTFDVVLVHDAVMYMRSRADLEAMARTAYEHLRPGGAVLIAPDCLRETLGEHCHLEEVDAEDGNRAMRLMEWCWDPDPDDETFRAEYVFLLRDGDDVRAVHDTHVAGVFARSVWLEVLEGAGFRVEIIPRPLGGGEHDEAFLGVRAPG